MRFKRGFWDISHDVTSMHKITKNIKHIDQTKSMLPDFEIYIIDRVIKKSFTVYSNLEP